MKRGFVLGKFLPPHKGHVFLCEFARNHCDHLTILVGALPNEPISGAGRSHWMRQLFPDCNVVLCCEDLPQAPTGPDDEEFWRIWKRVCQQYGGSETFDYVFASEDYGHRLATELGAKFVPCDMLRQTAPISGTQCRNDPGAAWDMIPDIVKPYFMKRVCLFGPESTGKSTVGKALADAYHTILVPEYGRTYTEVFGPDVGADDLMNIVQGHIASRDAAKALSGRIMFEDTDPVMTAVWSDMLIGKRDAWFEMFDDYADLYLLFDVDIPWVDDGTRYFKNDADRARFFETCENELIRRGVRYEIVRGFGQHRINNAMAAVDKAFGLGYWGSELHKIEKSIGV